MVNFPVNGNEDDLLGPSLMLSLEGYAAFMAVLSDMFADMAEVVSVATSKRRDDPKTVGMLLSHAGEKSHTLLRGSEDSLSESELRLLLWLVDQLLANVEKRLFGT